MDERRPAADATWKNPDLGPLQRWARLAPPFGQVVIRRKGLAPPVLDITQEDALSIERTIAEQVAEMHESRPRRQAFMADERRLAAQQAPSILLGVPFPPAQLVDATGQRTTLSKIADGRPAVVVLYRGSWCPYCNLALRTYQLQVLPELEAQGIRLIAISPEKEDGSLTLTERHTLAFPVLSDPADAIARALGVVSRPSDEALLAQRDHGLDLRDRNGDATADVPMPTVALVDSHGLLVWADVHPDHTTRTEPEQILHAIRDHFGEGPLRPQMG